jgi:hypothetical protein
MQLQGDYFGRDFWRPETTRHNCVRHFCGWGKFWGVESVFWFICRKLHEKVVFQGDYHRFVPEQ